MKLKKWWGFSALMLAGIGVAIPITLTTSCAEKKDWTFNNYNEFDNYLQKHKQDVSEAYIFSNTPNSTDYEFLKKNMNLQFFVNSNLFTIYIGLYTTSTEMSAIKMELHIKNKTT
ncbi:MAG: hypothetical protein LBD63_03930, partial [Mycoplasmataceae bacterium]|nr:hypothetical protein [Mycoplasmataceae bacterium]